MSRNKGWRDIDMRIKIVDCRQFPVDKRVVRCFLSLTRDTYRASHSTSVARYLYKSRTFAPTDRIYVYRGAFSFITRAVKTLRGAVRAST